MRTLFSKIAFTAALMLAITFTFSCSGDGGGGGNSDAIKREKISGVCEKGPFAKGSVVKIYELNAKFEKTKNSFEGKTDGKGYFEIEIKNGKLASPYIVLEVSGKYMNEVSGKLSTTPITLNAVADVSDKSKANVNVLTDLEYDRVMKKVKSGTKFEDAKKEAQKEVLNALGVSKSGSKNSEDISLFGNSPSDSVLLAVSVLLQGNRSTEEVSDLLADISREIENNGTLSNSTKSEVANGLADVDMDKVRDNILSLNPDAKVPDLSAFLPKDPDAPSSSSVVQSSGSENLSSSGKVSSSSSAKSSSSESPKNGQLEGDVFTDLRDGKKYKIEIDSNARIWMSENLNYSKNNTLGYCYGVDINGTNPHKDSTTCNNGYGRHYEWSVAMDGNSKQGLCPNGWHVPNTAEWGKRETCPPCPPCQACEVGKECLPCQPCPPCQQQQGEGYAEMSRMSKGFYIYPGNYNLNTKYPPVGWKDRDTSGYYWTSSGNSDFIGFWNGYACKSGGTCLMEYQSGATAEDYFSVRCIADNDFRLNCGTSSYIPKTQSCCGGKVYNLNTESCCNDKVYNLNTEFCSSALIYAKCNGKTYSPAIQECVDNIVRSKSGNHQIICNGGWQERDCSSNAVTLKVDECVEIYVLGYTNNLFLTNLIMRCEAQGTQSDVSVTLSLNGKSTTTTGSFVVLPIVQLGKIKLGDNDFGSLCLTAISGASSVKCTGPGQ